MDDKECGNCIDHYYVVVPNDAFGNDGVLVMKKLKPSKQVFKTSPILPQELIEHSLSWNWDGDAWVSVSGLFCFEVAETNAFGAKKWRTSILIANTLLYGSIWVNEECNKHFETISLALNDLDRNRKELAAQLTA